MFHHSFIFSHHFFVIAVTLSQQRRKMTPLPAAIRDQIRRAISIYDLNKVYEQDSMKKKDQEKLLHRLLVGDNSKGIPSSIETCLAAKKPFDRLFFTENQSIVTDTSETNNLSVEALQILTYCMKKIAKKGTLF